MKICILGPVISETQIGGVATFTEGLAEGFIKENHEVCVITTTKKVDVNSKNFNAIVVKTRGFLSFIMNRKKISKIVTSQNPDIIITSLEYCMIFKKIKKRNKYTTIHYLHGFKTYNYGIKGLLINHLFKRTRKYCDYYVSNSELTNVINNDLYGIYSDATIHIGYKPIALDNNVTKNEKLIVFAGRLVREKGVDKIIKAFNEIENLNDNIKLYIVGDGPELGMLKELTNNNNIIFLGKKSHVETVEIMQKAHSFISLNSHEPFGIVYLEALSCKCNIICPTTGGQKEFLTDRNSNFVIPNNIENIKNGIIESLAKEFDENSINLEYFSYKRVAQDICKMIKDDNKSTYN
ncbi:MAG: glycosyltransferase family 4 protein [bacterium]